MPRDLKIKNIERNWMGCWSLYESMKPVKLDERFVRNNGSIVYAVDSTLLRYVFGRPPEKRYKTGSGLENFDNRDKFQIFSVPPRQRIALKLRTSQRRLGELAVDFLLNGLAKIGTGESTIYPVALLPGHQMEAVRVYDDIVDEFMEQREHASKAKILSENLERYRLSIKIASENASWKNHPAAKNALMKLYQHLYDLESPHDRFFRFNKLLQNGLIVNSEKMLARLGWRISKNFNDGERYSSIYNKNRTVGSSSTGIVEGSALWWSGILGGFIPENMARTDITALMELDRINRIFKRDRKRMILYTFNEVIIEAGRHYFPLKYELNEADSNKSFSELYLRHPISVLSSHEFIRPSENVSNDINIENSKQDLESLLSEFFTAYDDLERLHTTDNVEGPASNDEVIDSNNILKVNLIDRLNRDNVEKILESKPDINDKFVERWISFIDSILMQNASVSPLAVNRLKDLAGTAENSAEGFSDFSSQILSRIRVLTEVSWSNFFKTTAEMGFEFIREGESVDVPAVYHVPLLLFRTHKLGKQILSSLWNVESVRTDATGLIEDFRNLGDSKKREHLYVFTLAYAILFAYMDRWNLTELLCLRALEVAKYAQDLSFESFSSEQQSELDMIDGREAHYLLAVTKRVRARGVNELVLARESLLTAIKMAEDCSNWDGLDPDATKVRIYCELVVNETVTIASKISHANDDSALVTFDRLLDVRDWTFFCLDGLKCKSSSDIFSHSCAVLRSEYFYQTSLLYQMVETWPNIFKNDLRYKNGNEKLGHLVSDQINAFDKIYPEARWLPFRGRTLLRFGAVMADCIESLPNEWKSSFYDVQSLFPSGGLGVRAADVRKLARVESQISRIISSELTTAL